MKRWKDVGLTLRDFRIQGFGVSNAKQQHTNTPKFRKVKGWRTNTSGFWDSGFQMLNNNTQPLLNSERCKGVGPTLQDFGIQGFRVWKSKGTLHKCNQQVPNA
jgi:hypothetical protein